MDCIFHYIQLSWCIYIHIYIYINYFGPQRKQTVKLRDTNWIASSTISNCHCIYKNYFGSSQEGNYQHKWRIFQYVNSHYINIFSKTLHHQCKQTVTINGTDIKLYLPLRHYIQMSFCGYRYYVAISKEANCQKKWYRY